MIILSGVFETFEILQCGSAPLYQKVYIAFLITQATDRMFNEYLEYIMLGIFGKKTITQELVK